jgi:hypothetical protein
MRTPATILTCLSGLYAACGRTPQGPGDVTDASAEDATIAVDADEGDVDATCGAQSEDIALVDRGALASARA